MIRIEKVSVLMVFLLVTGLTAFGQKGNFYVKKGLVLNGYDVVSYFEGTAKMGNEAFLAEYEGSKFQFTSSEHLNMFEANPKKYLPEYGGYCAYAMALSGKKVKINPETYEIRDGKLYLFYNSGNTNTLKSWLEESPEELIAKADSNWKKF